MRSLLVLFLTLSAGCAGDRPPAWAFDPIWLEPIDAGVHGFQTWNLYAKPWAKNRDPRHHLCSILVELDGAPTPCDDCAAAFAVQATLLEHDCLEGWLSNPLYETLERVAIGPPSADPDAPYPGQTAEGRADYGSGWEVHGFAYAEGLRLDGAGPDTWTGDAPFELWPTAAFPLD